VGFKLQFFSIPITLTKYEVELKHHAAKADSVVRSYFPVSGFNRVFMRQLT
jgi:hypothetical protein